VCGIAAVFHHACAGPVDRAGLLRARECMRARGPDGEGMWISPDQRVGLAHRRLSIIDVSEAGAQPMASADGTLRVVFNGEIYNYRELRAELVRRGRRLVSESDTEVLLHLYEERGPAMLAALRGMFAFALWDARRGGLLLARDPYGIKPLYYSAADGTVRAASQVKALLAWGGVDTAPQPAGHAGFFLWGSVPEPYTLYRGIRALPAGCTLWIGADGVEAPRAYASVAATLRDAARAPVQDAAATGERLRAAVLDSVRHHLVADVPVGVLLSAGVDSGALAGVASEQQAELRTVTLAFREQEGTEQDERALAETVARRYGTLHQTRVVGAADFQAQLPRLLAAMDQPSVDGVNTYFVARAAAECGIKVALSGLGGDELLGGYSTFRQVPRLVRWARPGRAVGRLARRAAQGWIGRFASPKYAGVLEYGGTLAGAYLLRRAVFMPWELPALLGPELARAGLEELRPLEELERRTAGIAPEHARVSALEQLVYMRNQLLRDADWAGMAHSLEIRVPLVDYRLLGALAPLIASAAPPTKRDLAAVPTRPLPREVVQRPKTGFDIPVRDWLHPGETGGGGPAREWARRVYLAMPHVAGAEDAGGRAHPAAGEAEARRGAFAPEGAVP